MKNCLKYLLENGHAEHVNVKWGNGHRNVIIIEGKSINIKGAMHLIRTLKIKFLHYI